VFAAFSLHQESPDLDPERQTPHFLGGSITAAIIGWAWASGHLSVNWLGVGRHVRRYGVADL
jgi:hypothetical protein